MPPLLAIREINTWNLRALLCSPAEAHSEPRLASIIYIFARIDKALKLTLLIIFIKKLLSQVFLQSKMSTYFKAGVKFLKMSTIFGKKLKSANFYMIEACCYQWYNMLYDDLYPHQVLILHVCFYSSCSGQRSIFAPSRYKFP